MSKYIKVKGKLYLAVDAKLGEEEGEEMKKLKYKGKIYEAVDDSASALMACDNAARRVAKFATLTRDKERKSIEDAFVFFEERVDSVYAELGKLLEQARRELAREALKYQKSVGIR